MFQKPNCWSHKQKRKIKPITMHVPMLSDWFSSSASASNPDVCLRQRTLPLCCWMPNLACSQTLYFLFKVRRAGVIKCKPQGIYWPPAQGGRGGGRREKKNKTMSVYRPCRSMLPQSLIANLQIVWWSIFEFGASSNSLADDWPAAHLLEVHVFWYFLWFDWSTLSYSNRTLIGDKEKSEKSPNCVLSSFFCFLLRLKKKLRETRCNFCQVENILYAS